MTYSFNMCDSLIIHWKDIRYVQWKFSAVNSIKPSSKHVPSSVFSQDRTNRKAHHTMRKANSVQSSLCEVLVMSTEELPSVSVDQIEGPRGQEPPHLYTVQNSPENGIIEGKPNKSWTKMHPRMHPS